VTSAEFADYNLFDYERRLAARELEALTSHADPFGLCAEDVVRGRATYFRAIAGVPTIQGLTETFHHSERGSRPSRQATRYLVHGLHEYKGKFNPQMARALINAIDPDATAIMDPYCGSGTTLVEGMRLGLSAVGVDQNPLAVWISRTKVGTLELAGTQDLVQRFDSLATRLTEAVQAAQNSGRAIAPPTVEEDDEAYLRHWFPEAVLAALWEGLRICREAADPVADVAQLCISNIVRQVSWQLPEDLRVRRRPDTWVPPAVSDLLSDALKKARLALGEVANASALPPTSTASVHLGSSRDVTLVERVWPEGRRLVVTSPPYATALPYIDTDRLSIVLLGLAPAKEIRCLERQLTGSREWRTSEANHWIDAWTTNAAGLPDDILEVLDRIEMSNRASNAGFRRRAVPPLLYRYFAHIGETLDALTRTMCPGEHVVMVVGSNRTGGADRQIEIQTPELLGQLSTTRGFEYTERIPFETWSRYGMHSRNAVNAEDAVVMTMRSD
jgi:hypothetical protein